MLELVNTVGDFIIVNIAVAAGAAYCAKFMMFFFTSFVWSIATTAVDFIELAHHS